MSIALQKGLVGHWPLDIESLKSSLVLGDKTPYGNDGISANTPVFTADRMGQANKAMVFDHTVNDVVIVPDNPILRPGTDDFTMGFWIKGPLAGTSSWEGIITKGLNTSAIAHTWGFLRSNILTNNLKYHQSSDAGGSWDVSINVVLPGGWNYILIRRYGSTLELYRNNSLVETDTSAGSDLSCTPDFKFGCDRATRYCSCLLADIRQYNRSLSVEERTALYEMYRPKLSPGSLQKGLVLDMPLSSVYTKGGAAGSEILTDKTPYSNDGQNNGAIIGTDYSTFVSANSDYIDCGNSSIFDLNDAMTLSAWMRFTGNQNARGLGKFTTTPHPYAIYPISTGKMRMSVSGGGTGEMAQSTTQVNDGIWHLATGTYDKSLGSNNIKIYLDGILEGTENHTLGAGINTDHLLIGKILTNYLDGDIGKVRIYNRELSNTEILLLFDSQKGLFL